ncbi:insulin-like receptor isoform X2 [Bradysia coprophila]|nr:insulin-like receptor isoform X2 [Bradysia coprophila]
MIDIVKRVTPSKDPPITSTDEQTISNKKPRNERSSHARRKDKSIPKPNLTEMTTNKRTQCSNKDKQANCLHSENYWSDECMDGLSCSFKSNHKSTDKSSFDSDTFYRSTYRTSKHQQENRISQSSNNQKSALAQCKSNNTISSYSNKCTNRNESNLTVKNVQNCQELNKRWKRWSISTILSQSSLMLLCVLMLMLGASVVDAVTKDGICQSRDIRNNPSELNSLKNCRVIEGFLMISLIDRYNETDYDNITFPNLVEITDYLLLYRVQGLKTLMHLFPNLRVIRGNNLVGNYALIIYEMLQLQEIGLKGLTTISRGSVRIEKNPFLCFVDTIDWTYIANGTTMEEHFFNANRKPNECNVCPSGKRTDADGNVKNGGEIECPSAKHDHKKRFCWNRQTCQKICPDSCGGGACDDNLNCCDKSCLGSCNSDGTNCTLCKNLSVGRMTALQCVDKCPNGLYQYEDRRCITDVDCWNVTTPFTTEQENSNNKNPFIPFAGMCTINCPEQHSAIDLDDNSGRRSCKPCDGVCKKECHGSVIENIAEAQNYRGCIIITGTLILQIRQGGKNVVRELELALSNVEEIEGSLKITRSFALVSLSFFRRLKVIQGKRLADSYALAVMDNQNLQNLFDHPVTIARGRIFFHFNPKLCYNVIEGLKNDTIELRHVSRFAVEDVAPNSNGDKVACNLATLSAKPVTMMAFGAVIEVRTKQYEDSRVLLGYVLYYKQAPYRNVTLFDNRDACGGDGWRVEDTSQFDRKASHVQIVITNLKPYTQYAYYVKTYTISSEPSGGQTDILYFTTLPWQPEAVQKLKIIPNGSRSFIVNWEPPKVANGELTNYIVRATLVNDDPFILSQRNYCDEPLKIDEEKIYVKPVEQPKPEKEKVPNPALPTLPNECVCPEEDEYEPPPLQSLDKSDELEQIIDFENQIQNIVYVKRKLVITGEEPKIRRRRTTDAARKYSNQTIPMPPDGVEEVFPTRTDDKEKPDNEPIVSKMVDDYYVEFYNNETAANIHTFTLNNLKHYTMYRISVQACRNFNDSYFSIDSHCSNIVMGSFRTGKLEHADDIPYLEIKKSQNSNNSSSSSRLYWPEPKSPNGLILSYTVTYKRVDLDNVKATEYCVTHKMYKDQHGEIPFLKLSNGNYSVSVKATSLAGDGRSTPAKTVIIDESKISSSTIAFIVIGVILIVVVIVYGFWLYFRRRFGSPVSDLKLIASVNPEYVGMQYQVDEWEVPRDNVIQLRELGQGSFGMVYEGVVKNKDGESVPCAIKTVNENATDRERINFLKEAGVMKAFDTHHVVRLLGVVSITQPTLVVMELMKYGDLKGYLRSHRADADVGVTPIAQPPTLKRVLQMALEIADGMAYLAAKKFVHRDLAARNCMVAYDLTVKIGDFGMTRDIYETDYYRKGTKGLLPVRWMAPESLKDGVFTSSSDVFSYGIVLWEIATGASQPYQGLSNDQVLRYVIDGGVMERPENCPEKLYKLMCRTWQHRPSSRPTFLQIVTMLLDDADQSFRGVSFYFTHEGQELLLQPQNRGLVIDVTTPLKAEEDDFSLDDLPDAFLMSDVHTSKTDGGASHSPLR